MIMIIPAFIADLSSLPTTTSAELHQSLSTTLDKYAPLVTRTTITRPDSSWSYTSSLLKQKCILPIPPITSGPNTELRWRRIRPMILK